MRTMLFQSVSVVALVCAMVAVSSTAVADDAGPHPAELERFMEATARAYKGELDGAQVVRDKDLTGDGVPDLVALVNIVGLHGGSNHVQHLAVFRGTRRGEYVLLAQADVGAKGDTVAERIAAIRGRTVVLETSTHIPGEDMASPGWSGRMRVVLRGKTLRVFAPRPVKR